VPEGRVGYAEVMEHEDVFFVTFAVSFVSIIVLRKGKGNMRGRIHHCDRYILLPSSLVS